MNAPAELTELDQWVTWNYQGPDKRKVPYNARTGSPASSTDAETWSAFGDACAAAQRRHHAGVGFVFTDYDPYVGVDLDDSLGEGGAPLPWAAPIIAALGSYTEVSPSGKGVKVWVKGEVPQNLKTARIEIYKHKRYFTVTGRHLEGTPTEIREANGALTQLYEQVRKAREAERRRAYVDAAFRREVESVRGAQEGNRNNQLFASAAALAGFVKSHELDEHTVRDALKDAAKTGGLSDHEIDQTLDSAFTRAEPRDVPPDKNPPLPASDIVPASKAPPAKPVGRVEYVVADWKPNIINAADLAHTVFEALTWTVDGLLPEGACLLAAKPKSKKSWLALAVSIAVASSGKALGFFDVAGGRVLYLDLESNQRRMQSRLRSVLGNDSSKWPKNFELATEWPRGDDALRAIEGYCLAKPDTRLIVIDILARVRPPKDPKADPYEQDYTFLQSINALAERLRITIIVIHHTRKAKADDIFDEVSGTTAITGAVATIWMMSRSAENPDEQMLHLRGRDLIDEEPIAIKWDAYTCQHIFVAAGSEASSSAERRKVLDAMDEDSEYQMKEIAALIGKSIKATDNLLRRLVEDNSVQRTGRGRYAKIPKPQHPRGIRGIRGIDGQSGNGGITAGGNYAPESINPPSNSTIPHNSTSGGVELPTASGRRETPQNDEFHEFHGDQGVEANDQPAVPFFVQRGAAGWEVVELDGRVISSHATEDEAEAAFWKYAEAYFGKDGE